MPPGKLVARCRACPLSSTAARYHTSASLHGMSTSVHPPDMRRGPSPVRYHGHVDAGGGTRSRPPKACMGPPCGVQVHAPPALHDSETAFQLSRIRLATPCRSLPIATRSLPPRSGLVVPRIRCDPRPHREASPPRPGTEPEQASGPRRPGSASPAGLGPALTYHPGNLHSKRPTKGVQKPCLQTPFRLWDRGLGARAPP